MKTEVILTAKTVEEAVMNARSQYGTDDNEITYEVLELPKKGFLGFGAAPAKIKVIISQGENILDELKIKSELNLSPEKKPKQSNTPKSQNQSKIDSQQPKPEVKQQPKPQQPKVNQNQPKTDSPKPVQTAQTKPQINANTPKPQNQPKADSQQPKIEVNQNIQKAENTPNINKPRPEKKPAQNIQNKKPPVKDQRERPAETPRIREDAEEVTLSQEELGCAVSFLEMLLGHMELEGVKVTPLELEERRVNLDGEGSGVLIGHHGETLDAIQYLTNLHVNRKAETADSETEGDANATERKRKREYVKVTIDIEGYRARREETLRVLARRMADRALKYKKNIFLEPMNPYERRIIHSEIQLIEGVSTHSVGSDDNRKIVITVNGLQQSRGGYKGNNPRNKKPNPVQTEKKTVLDISEPETDEDSISFSSEDEGISIED